MPATSTQTFSGRYLSVSDEIVVRFENVLYGGECTAIDELDQPSAIFDGVSQTGGPFTYYGGADKNLAPDMTWMWHVLPE